MGALVLAVVTGCAVAGSAGVSGSSPQPEDAPPTGGAAASEESRTAVGAGDDPTSSVATGFLSCGDRVDALPSAAGLTITATFPDRVAGSGDGMFGGTVTLTSTGPEVSGVASPEADVYVARSGVVVATALPKDLVGRPVRIAPGTEVDFPAHGSLQSCGTPSGPLPLGDYEMFAMIAITQDDGATLVVTGGPWPIEVT
jgi:hypothetical protein